MTEMQVRRESYGESVPPPLRGVSHISLSVEDVAAAARFWVDVMGFESVADEPGYRIFLDRRAPLGIVVTDHASSVRGPFDERRVGLDHVAMAVSDADALGEWERHLTGRGVPHSGITPSAAGLHLNLRAPDGVALELYVMGDEVLATLGLDPAAVR